MSRMSDVSGGRDRRRVEDELREREEQYRAIFESTSDGLIINDPARGVVVEANPAVCRMHGYRYDEFIGLHATAFIHPDYHDVFAEFVETITAGGTYQTDAVDLRKDGSPFPVEVHGSSVMYRGRPHILAVVRDVTERVEAYELLEQRVEERTRELSTLLDISRHVASTLELGPLLELILDQLQAVVESDGTTLLTLEDDDFVILVRRIPGTSAAGFPTRYQAEGHGMMWEMLRRGEPVIIPDVHGADPLAAAYRQLVGDYLETSLSFERSFMAVPMMLKDRLVGLLALSSAQTGLYTAHHARLTLAVAQQAAVAIENARLYGRAQEMAVLEERQRLSRELHDSVSQALYSIALGNKTARAWLDRDPGRAVEPLEFAIAQAERGLAEMRALIFALRPDALEQEGLLAALQRQASALAARHRIDINLELADEPDLPLPVKEALFRIAQEALHNTVKHAGPGSVRVVVRSGDEETILQVKDDGQGFDPTASYPGHLGLRSMEERTTAVGGTLHIDSAPGAGTTITVRAPRDGGRAP